MRCEKCSKEIDDNVKYCQHCGNKIQKGNNKEVRIIIGILIIIGSLYFFIDGINGINNKETSVTNVKTSSTTVKESKKEFKDSCKEYSYKTIARNPSQYDGKRVKFTGKVAQVSEGLLNNKSITILMQVTKDEYGFYDDVIYCTYTYSQNESKILEDDIITIYGTCKGDITYTSLLGANITVPNIEIKYYELNDEG